MNITFVYVTHDQGEALSLGDRVAVMLRNSPEWVTYDQAALGLGLVVVPLYTQDRPDNVAYILNDAECRVLLLGTFEQWKSFDGVRDHLRGVKRVVVVEPVDGGAESSGMVVVEVEVLVLCIACSNCRSSESCARAVCRPVPHNW